MNPAPGPDTGLTLRWTDVGVALLLPLSVLPFATVHEGWRAALAVGAALIGGLALLRGLDRRRPSLGWWLPTVGFGLALLLSAGAFLPLSAQTRATLAPAVSPAVQTSLDLAGIDLAPLALEMNRGLQEWALSLALVVALLALGLLVRDGRRASRMAWIALSTGLGVLGLALAHRALGLEFIWGESGIPAFSREPFFGTFVNPNHGGLYCAALVPLAFGLGLRKEGSLRTLAWVISGLMVLGALFAQSRGALLALAAGVLVGGALMDRRTGLVGLAGLVCAGLALLVVGPTQALVALSEFVVPEALQEGQDLVTGRGELLADALRLAEHGPLLGVGPAGFDDAFQMVKASSDFSYTAHAHNELIQTVVEAGWPATLAWLLGFGALAVRAFRVAPTLSLRRRALLAGFGGVLGALASATLFTFPLRIGALQVLGVVAAGCLLGLSEVSQRRASSFRPQALAGSLLALAVLGLARLAPADATWGPAEPALERARLALSEQRPQEAQEALHLALARRPAHREALQLLVRAEAQLGDVEGAFAAAHAATVVYPTLPWVWRDLARLQRRVGDFTESRDTWRRVLELDLPDEDRAAVVREALQGPGLLVPIAEQVLPDRADVLVIAALELEQAGEVEEAELRFRRAAELHERYGAWLAAFFLRQQRPEEALAAATGDSCFAREVSGNALLKLDRSEEALQLFEAAMGACGEEEGRGHRLRVGLARARMETGDPRGVQSMEALLVDRPEDAQLLRLLAREARDQKHRSRLVGYLERLVAAEAASPREAAELERLHAGLPLE